MTGAQDVIAGYSPRVAQPFSRYRYGYQMPAPLSSHELADLLPGTWTIAATNFPFWLNGERTEARLNYSVRTAEPLVIDDVVEYLNAAGVEKRIVGVDRLRGGVFTWRGKGLLTPLTSRWAVTGWNHDRSIVTIQYDKSRVTPAGLDILIRADSPPRDIRSAVASDSSSFGLTAEQFASLSWDLPRR